jgi:hypothetical protein
MEVSGSSVYQECLRIDYFHDELCFIRLLVKETCEVQEPDRRIQFGLGTDCNDSDLV